MAAQQKTKQGKWYMPLIPVLGSRKKSEVEANLDSKTRAQKKFGGGGD